MASKQTVTAFVLDVSPAMGDVIVVDDDAKPGLKRTTTGLDLCRDYVAEKLGEKILRALKTDKVVIFTAGDEKTNNSIANGGQEGYDNINEVIPLTPASVDHQKALKRIDVGPVEGDCLSAAIVAISAMQAEVQAKKWKRELIIMTDGMSDIDWSVEGGVETFRDMSNAQGVELTVVGVNFDDNVLGYKQEDKPAIKRTNETMWSTMIDSMEAPSIYGNAIRALAYVRAPRPTPVSGTASKTTLTFGDVNEHPDHSLNLQVHVSKCVMPARPMSQKKMSTLSGLKGRNVIEPSVGLKRKRPADDDAGREGPLAGLSASFAASQNAFRETQTQSYSNGQSSDKRQYASRDATFGINRDRKYYYVVDKPKPEALSSLARNGGMPRTASQARQDDAMADAASSESEDDEEAEEPQREEVPEGVEMVKAYKYGATRVPMNGVDDSDLQMTLTPGIEILGFADRTMIRREQHLGGAWWVFGSPDSGQSQVTCSVLIHALYEKDMVAIVRFVATSKNPTVKMAALYPRFQDPEDMEEGQDRWEGFVMLQLPFADDVRQYSFPSLDHLVSKSGKVLEEHKYLPTDDMDNAMRKFVEKNNLDTAGRDEDGDVVPWYNPRECCNPSVHNIKRAVLYRANNPKDPDLPVLHPDLAKYLHPPPINVERSKDALANVIELFQIKKVPPKPKKQKAGFAPIVAQGDKQGAAIDLDALLADVKDVPMDHWAGGRRLGGDMPPPPAPRANEEDAMDLDQPASGAERSTLTDGYLGDNTLVGCDDPLGDYQRVKQDRGTLKVDALGELLHVAHETFKLTTGSSAHKRVLAILNLARTEAMELEECRTWNDFAREFKNAILSSRHAAFWPVMQRAKLGLWTEDDVVERFGDGKVEEGLATPHEAQRFLA